MSITESGEAAKMPSVPPAQNKEVAPKQEQSSTSANTMESQITKGKGKEVSKPITSEDMGEKKLSNAELKAKQKAEKAAKRAAAKGQQNAAEVVTQSSPAPKAGKQPQQQQSRKQQGNAGPSEGRNLPVRGGPSRAAVAPVVPDVPKKEDKSVEFFRHLYKPRTFTLAGVNKDVHPAVLALGLQISNYTICGSDARLVATLQAFKRVCIPFQDTGKQMVIDL